MRYHLYPSLVRVTASDDFYFENSWKRLSHSQWSGKRTTDIEHDTVASQFVKEHGVPGLHRPVGGQHIVFIRDIKVKCVCIYDAGKDVFPIGSNESIGCLKGGEQVHITWTDVMRMLFMPGDRTEENHREQDVSTTLDQQAHLFFD